MPTFDSESETGPEAIARCTARRLLPGVGYVVWRRRDWREVRRFATEPRHHLVLARIYIDFAEAPLGFSNLAEVVESEIDGALARSVGEQCGCGNGFERRADVAALAIIITAESEFVVRWLPLCADCTKKRGDDLEHAVRIAYQVREGTAAEFEYLYEVGRVGTA